MIYKTEMTQPLSAATMDYGKAAAFQISKAHILTMDLRPVKSLEVEDEMLCTNDNFDDYCRLRSLDEKKEKRRRREAWLDQIEKIPLRKDQETVVLTVNWGSVSPYKLLELYLARINTLALGKLLQQANQVLAGDAPPVPGLTIDTLTEKVTELSQVRFSKADFHTLMANEESNWSAVRLAGLAGLLMDHMRVLTLRKDEHGDIVEVVVSTFFKQASFDRRGGFTLAADLMDPKVRKYIFDTAGFFRYTKYKVSDVRGITSLLPKT